MAKTDKTTGDGALEATDVLAPPQEAIALEAPGAAATPGELRPLAAWAAERRTPAWKVAGLLRHQGWTEDRAVSAAEYDQAVTAFERRPLGA